MTRLVRVPLGCPPVTGKHAVDSCVRFKEQVRGLLPSADGAWLLTVDDNGKRGIEAVYDADTAGAKEWAERAEALAPELWAKLAERRKGVLR